MARLLIVDNDERIVELSAWFLRRLGHEVDKAHSYREAREVMTSRWPDLMLADLDLGLERGQEELPKLANEGLLPATLVVSGFLDAKLDASLRGIPGVLGTVAKPVDLHDLEGRIRACLDSGKLVSAPGSAEVLGPVPDVDNLPEEADDEEGWVEIAPLAPGIDPVPVRANPWEERSGALGSPAGVMSLEPEEPADSTPSMDEIPGSGLSDARNRL